MIKLKLNLKNKLRAALASVLGVFCASEALANPNNFPVGRPTLECVSHVARQQQVPIDLMLGVNSVERGNTGQLVRNTNATYDIGAFQINTIHLPMVAQQFGGTKSDLANRGCFNAYVASHLLRAAIYHPKKQHLDFYTRASGYHSWTPHVNRVYREKLMKYTKQWQAWLDRSGYSHWVSAPRIH